MSESFEERRRRLKEEADRAYPQAWRPENPGDELAGIVQEIRMRPTKFGPVPVMTIVDGIGSSCSLWLVHTVLRNEMYRQQVVEGEFVYVRWEGKRQPEGDGAAYDAYTVRVDRPESRFDWALAGPAPDDFLGVAAHHPSAADPHAPDAPFDDIPY